ncbi:hypothetical protein AX17_003740 [Amanita inopinata Kibby_2008]|nr:hypothetical protein AX17_003740 [Amanita inopinata Kibby_2008]
MNLGLTNIVRDRLLRGLQAQKPTRAELYDMNVYGEGSFFKAHRDTPRNERMFGSLVIFYPTPHEGGALIIRKGDKEWMFDSAKELAEHNEPYIGYVAFYSNVEHEVALVTSGTTFETLLGNPEFLLDGGYLGFGLEYEYPLPGTYTPLDDLEKCLKGSDAEIMGIIKELSLDVSLWGLIEGRGFKVACKDYFPNYNCQSFDDASELAELLLRSNGAEMIEHRGGKVAFEVNWVTEPTSLNHEENAFPTYGNEASIDYSYHNICMIVRVGKPGQRTAFSDTGSDESSE